MLIDWRLVLLPPLFLLSVSAVSPQQNHSAAHPGDRIYLDAVVRPKSGRPTKGLQQPDFTILDNDVPQIITSFEAVDGRHAQVEVVLVLDAVNVDSREAAIEGEEIKRFLKEDRGRLAYPTRLAVLTDKGLQFQEEFTQDGTAISSALDHHTIPRHSMDRDADHGGAANRFDIAFQGFAQLLVRERERPGRKLIVWVSPGWPPLVGLQNTRDAGLREKVFGNIVEISTQLREAQITVYSIDPSAIGEIEPGLTDPPTNHLRPSDRNVYIEGASNPSDILTRDFTIGAIAVQSGGLALNPGNDLVGDLQKCVADAGAYYELSFDPLISDQPDQYHHLEIRVAKPGLTARTRQGYYSQPWPAKKSTAQSASVASAGANEQAGSANLQPYLDEPLAQLVERIPELKTLQPAPGQQELPEILQKVGRRVDDFMHDVGDLIADEDVTQERLDMQGRLQSRQHVQDSYLVLHHGYEWGANAEYRMDEKGNRLGPIGLERGYLVTSGYALSCISFSTVVQAQSRFRYLGEEKKDARETYVLGFAQKPGEATFTTTMTGTGGTDVDLVTQGILWVDKNDFQIIRMRSDLLAPSDEIRLDQLTTAVTFGEVQLQDAAKPLWLPRDVDVSMKINKQSFHNVHHYTNYRRYRVSVKIATPQ